MVSGHPKDLENVRLVHKKMDSEKKQCRQVPYSNATYSACGIETYCRVFHMQKQGTSNTAACSFPPPFLSVNGNSEFLPVSGRISWRPTHLSLPPPLISWASLPSFQMSGMLPMSSRFYTGKVVFITGATGFVGKAPPFFKCLRRRLLNL